MLRADERAAWHWRWWKRGLPALAAVLSVLLVAAPPVAPIPVAPLLPLLCVIVWTLYQPRLMPTWAALIVGLATDLALAMPVGVNATLMPALTLALRNAEPYLGQRSFAIDWALTGPVIAVYQLAACALMALVGATRDPTLLIAQTLITWAVFPAVARAAVWAQRRIGFQ